ncbi:hypothetical protein GCM10010191_10020 [Actinomadura vinacea]|uniref:Secreted protein n=1 Tax=Actinomadura vinacea TaxID=115336 RepID=A0ABP5VIL5_9ACTN
MNKREMPANRRRILPILGLALVGLVVAVVAALLTGALTGGQDDSTERTPVENQTIGKYTFAILPQDPDNEEHFLVSLTVRSPGTIKGEYTRVTFNNESGTPGEKPRQMREQPKEFTGTVADNRFKFDDFLLDERPVTGTLTGGGPVLDDTSGSESKGWKVGSATDFEKAVDRYADTHRLKACPADPDIVC